ncbi:hypothetical protein VOLCADRAFT_91371 [Volvox carteri f. nagariensis]|uniref:Uncharacterized protein n=1 Tax=Volvox carteri f. nagariensis TaxID=3068 RepID=D8TWW4_VOLCA|nr:uncharacterized protein VOLCADRAFT_91371 [Volvox carteri f. nagariensis]EFJ48118.1 hypothetical protein VOLCADRAFT_91371 [Volvox carteri f. nagariensis]|eukprot:XP_002950803.1 hypothetical protein VOLCADRAFT_91371 [Volvox carteri f. nagariensis]
MAAPVLKIEIDELTNSIQHLERSNRELKELLQTDPDPEYRLAIGENITTIAKKRARVAALEEELRRLTGEEYESDAVALPVADEVLCSEDAASRPASTAGPDGMQIEDYQRRTHAAEPTADNMELDPATGMASAAGSSGSAGAGASTEPTTLVARCAGVSVAADPQPAAATDTGPGSGAGVWL